MNSIITDFKNRRLADNFLIIACLSAGLGLAGCQQEGSAEKTGQKIDDTVKKVGEYMENTSEKAGDKMDSAKHAAQKKADIAEEYIDDAMITLKVKNALAGDQILGASHIETKTVNGVVTLSGSVDSEQSLGRAMELANGQEHVKSVVTKMLVKTTPMVQ